MFTITLTAIVAFAVTGILGFKLIPWLRKLKYGQTILDIGPIWHKKKQGTPTMGGLMFIIGILVSVAVSLLVDFFTDTKAIVGENSDLKTRVWGGLAMALGFAFVGFFDDYIKVVKKRNLGLTARQKTIFQLLISVAYLASLYMSSGSKTIIPFVNGNSPVDVGAFYWIIGVIIIYGFVNAVNLTDGVDGLCASVTTVVAVSFTVAAILQNMWGVGMLAAALAGGCVGFLIWNWNPAKVFMGDTGSMFLGGLVVALAFGVNCPIILLPMGIVYLAEAMSVVIQVTYFKLTHGKRIFKMTPIHHHFEMSGWSEKKIVVVFSIVTAIGCAIGVFLMQQNNMM